MRQTTATAVPAADALSGQEAVPSWLTILIATACGLIEKERSIARQKADEDAVKAQAEGKKPQPAEILAKRIDGSVQKYLKEVSLLDQPFVKK